jgi:outer membrane protein assembly factor BamB
VAVVCALALVACAGDDAALVGADAGLVEADASVRVRLDGAADATSVVAVEAGSDATVPSATDATAAPALDATDGTTTGEPPAAGAFALVRRFPTAALPGVQTTGCTYASPVVVDEGGTPRIVIADGSGAVTAVDPATGESVWSVTLPAPSGEQAFVVATPVVAGDLLVVAYHTVAMGTSPLLVTAPRLRHRVAVIDLAAQAISADFTPFDLTASVDGPFGDFGFEPGQAMARGSLVRAVPAGGTLGRVYVTFGNVRDLQPYRGWVFEVDLDVWKASGPQAALTATLPTAQDVACGPQGGDGARAQMCGAGVWSPAGPLVVDGADGAYRVLLPVGNGQLDPSRGDYGNTMLRTGPGLDVDAGCDPAACQDFSVETLASSCVETCADLFIPRLLPGEDPILPASGACAGLGVWDCWIAQDQLDGASSPVAVLLPSGRRVLVYPTKDGHLWLVDYDRMGTVYAHQELAASCGTTTDPCEATWSGTIATQPALTTIDGAPAVVVPTFMPDTTHPAGVFALKVVEDDGTPQFESAWQFPAASATAVTTTFRGAPSRAIVAVPAPAASVDHAFVVDVGQGGSSGTLYAIRTGDGILAAQATLAGPGYRFTAPLYVGGTVFVVSCPADSGPGSLEAYDVVAPDAGD